MQHVISSKYRYKAMGSSNKFTTIYIEFLLLVKISKCPFVSHYFAHLKVMMTTEMSKKKDKRSLFSKALSRNSESNSYTPAISRFLNYLK